MESWHQFTKLSTFKLIKDKRKVMTNHQRWSPCGHNWSLWSRSLLVFENALTRFEDSTIFLTCWKCSNVISNVVSSWSTLKNLRIFQRRSFFFEIASISPKIFEFFEWRRFFYWKTLLCCFLALGLGLEHSCPRAANSIDFYSCSSSSLSLAYFSKSEFKFEF